MERCACRVPLSTCVRAMEIGDLSVVQDERYAAFCATRDRLERNCAKSNPNRWSDADARLPAPEKRRHRYLAVHLLSGPILRFAEVSKRYMQSQ